MHLILTDEEQKLTDGNEEANLVSNSNFINFFHED